MGEGADFTGACKLRFVDHVWCPLALTTSDRIAWLPTRIHITTLTATHNP